jgi:hypothetical protein
MSCRKPLVELYEERIDTRYPASLRESREHVVFAALDVELEKIDVLELELLEHFRHISDLSGRHFDVPLLREIVVGKETGTRSLNSHRQGVVTTAQAVFEDGYVLIIGRALVKTLKRTWIRLEGVDPSTRFARHAYCPIPDIRPGVDDHALFVEVEVDQEIGILSECSPHRDETPTVNGVLKDLASTRRRVPSATRQDIPDRKAIRAA